MCWRSRKSEPSPRMIKKSYFWTIEVQTRALRTTSPKVEAYMSRKVSTKKKVRANPDITTMLFRQHNFPTIFYNLTVTTNRPNKNPCINTKEKSTVLILTSELTTSFKSAMINFFEKPLILIRRYHNLTIIKMKKKSLYRLVSTKSVKHFSPTLMKMFPTPII
jgi:hypothetical protein